MTDTVIYTGGAVRRDEGGRVRGMLAPFGSEDNLDAYGTFFHAETDFGSASRSVTLYEHGMDPDIGKRTFDDSAALTRAEGGIGIEAMLDTEDMVAARMLRLVDQDMMGWSSGTAAHLVEAVELDSGAIRIDRWPLGLDASLTTRPANKEAVALRHEMSEGQLALRKAATPVKRYFQGISVSSNLRSINSLFNKRALARRLQQLNEATNGRA